MKKFKSVSIYVIRKYDVYGNFLRDCGFYFSLRKAQVEKDLLQFSFPDRIFTLTEEILL